MWLSGLHVPESYLTALVQATCRRNGWPLDKSTLYTTVTHYVDPEDINEHTGQGKVPFLNPCLAIVWRTMMFEDYCATREYYV